MKSGIHPQYYSGAQVVCSCGNMFEVGSTQENIHIELCNKCHPFYTGQQKFVDTASRIEKFESKKKKAEPKKMKADASAEQEDNTPKSLKEMLQALKKG